MVRALCQNINRQEQFDYFLDVILMTRHSVVCPIHNGNLYNFVSTRMTEIFLFSKLKNKFFLTQSFKQEIFSDPFIF